MKFLNFESLDGSCRLGVLLEGAEDVVEVDDLLDIPLRNARSNAFVSKGIGLCGNGLQRWLQLEDQQRAVFCKAVQERLSSNPPRLKLDELSLLAPVPRPGKIVGVGRNYADHAAETGVKPFEKPRIIFKMTSSVSAPNSTVFKPLDVEKMDFEVELAVVMGDFAKNVSEHDALRFVAGYTVLNDLSAREFQFDISPAQTTFAKSIDGFCPMGPWLVTKDEIPDPQKLRVTCEVNGKVMQDASTSDMLFPVKTLISYISRFMTLEPGDVIATGTPAGIGAFRKPPQWLQSGDRVELEVSGIGRLLTRIG